jgi:hypothetical protein
LANVAVPTVLLKQLLKIIPPLVDPVPLLPLIKEPIVLYREPSKLTPLLVLLDTSLAVVITDPVPERSIPVPPLLFAHMDATEELVRLAVPNSIP